MKPVVKQSLILSILAIILSIIVFVAIARTQKTSIVKSSGRANDVAVENALTVSTVSADLSHAPTVISRYSQDDFSSPDIASARLSSSVQYRQVDDGRTISTNHIPPAVLSTVKRLNAARIGLDGPGYEIFQLLSVFSHFQSPPPAGNPGKFGLIDNTPEDPELIKQDEQMDTMLRELDIDAPTIRCDLMSVNLLELIERVSKDAQVDVGLFPDGRLSFGYVGKWASSNPPVYQLEFSDKQ